MGSSASSLFRGSSSEASRPPPAIPKINVKQPGPGESHAHHGAIGPSSQHLGLREPDLDEVLAETFREGVQDPGWDKAEHREA